MARFFWTLGAALSGFALLLAVFGGAEVDGVIDYRAWLLLALGILAVVIGNFSQPAGHGR